MYLNIFLLILNLAIIGLLYFLKEKIKNAATIQDIRALTSEEQKGKFEVDAARDSMASITHTDVLMEKLCLRMCLEAISKRDEFIPTQYSLTLFDLWSELIGSLDKNYILLPQSAQQEVDYFRNQWPHFLGGKHFKWVGNTLSTVLIKNSAIKIFRHRMSSYLDLNVPVSSKKEFNHDEASEQYKIAKLNESCGKANSDLGLNLIACGLPQEIIREMFPDITFSFMTAEEQVGSA